MNDQAVPTSGAGPRFARIGPYKRPGDRRAGYRRFEDRAAHAALAFSARASVILARDAQPPDAVGRILALLARTGGARRAAALVALPDRTVYTAVASLEPPRAAIDLAAWLDSAAHRARRERAARPAARIEIVTLAEGGVGVPGRAPDHPVRVAISLGDPGEPGVTVLGLDFASRRSARLAPDRLPPTLLRQAAGSLAVAGRIASDRGVSEVAAASDDERRRFVSTVAHELRTPLTGLSGYLDLLLEDRGGDPAVSAEFLERCRRIVESMGELVNDLLEVSRIEAGSLDLAVASFPLADVLTACRDALEPIAAAGGVALDVSTPSRLRAALGDRRAAERIVLNLVGNAVKYTPRGGRVDVDTVFDGPVALVVVRDTGPGIPPADRERIFERFARLDEHRPLPGSGLGLPIARDLARLMGGDIVLASRPGVGSCFCLALPGPTGPDVETVRVALDRVVADERTRLDATEAGSPPPAAPDGAVIHQTGTGPTTRG